MKTGMADDSSSFTIISCSPLPHSRVEIQGEVSALALETYRARAVVTLGERVTLDGFRAGHIPEHILESRVGTTGILEEMAFLAVSNAYPRICADQKLNPIENPDVIFTKLAPGLPLAFTLSVTLMPHVALPDYRALAREAPRVTEPPAVNDEEIAQAIDIVRHLAQGESLVDDPAIDHTPVRGESNPEMLPELTDDIVRSWGRHESVADFTEFLRELLREEKAQERVRDRRADIARRLAEATTIDLPETLVESELVQMRAEIETEIESAGKKFSDYRAHVQKSEDDLRGEWRPHAEKRAALNLIVNEIARRENIAPDPQKVQEVMTSLTARHPSADKDRVRALVTFFAIRDLVFEMLEGLE